MASPKVVMRFDAANPRANRRIKELAGGEITRITEDMKVAVRETILAGYSKGKHPNAIALDLVGRIDPTTQKRTGGILGLTSGQAKAARTMRERLQSGEPSEMQKVLGLALRDKRFDKTILSAIAGEKEIPADKISRMYQRYVDNSIQLRGETVARTETGQAVHAAAHEAFQQGLDKTGYTDSAIIRIWRTAGDNKVRNSHAEMDGQTVRGLNTPFISGNDVQMLHPLDGSLGAGAGDIINCRCDEEINIDYSEGLKTDAELDAEEFAAGQRKEETPEVDLLEADLLEADLLEADAELVEIDNPADAAIGKPTPLNDTILEILAGGGGTIEEMTDVLAATFVDRTRKSLMAKLKQKLIAFPEEGLIDIIQEGDRYYGKAKIAPTGVPAFKIKIERADYTDPASWYNANSAITGFRKRHGVQLTSSLSNPGLDSMFVYRARNADEVLTDFKSRFPGFQQHVKLYEIKIHASTDKHIPVVTTSPTGQVYNEATGMYFSEFGRLEMSGKLAARKSGPLTWGDWVVRNDDTFSSTLAHELGHALEEYVFARASILGLIPKIIDVADWQDRRTWLNQFLQFAFADKYTTASVLSKYGVSTAGEFWAEAFSAWSHPDYAQSTIRLPRDIENIFDQVLMKVYE